MALSFHEVLRGLRVGNSVFISGTGAPGGSGDADVVGVGSFYLDDANGALYTKVTAGTGADKWKKQASEEFVANLSNALGHKKSVRLATAAALAAYTPAGSGVGKTLTANANGALTVDGVAAALNDRVLVKDENSGGSHVDHGIYIVTQVGDGSNPWILTRATDADQDAEMLDGQFVIVNEGTQAAQGWVLVTNDPITVDTTALDYVRFGSDVTDELGFIRTFIGKGAAGSETPTYSSTNYVSNGTSLETAIGALDAQVGTNASNIATNTSNIATNASNIATNASNIATNTANIATNAANIAEARTETTSTNVTTVVTVDSVLVDSVAAVKWVVYVQGNALADAAKKQAVEILAVHDGHNVSGGADATTADYTVYSRLKIGTITGLDITVDITGTGASQSMRLRVVSTMACDVSAIREIVQFAA